MKDEKILQEEMLSDEELDNVVGGTFEESLNDGYFFRDQIFKSEYYKGNAKFIVCRMAGAFYPQTHHIASAFKDFGVQFIHHEAESVGNIISNEYFIDGKQVSQREAWDHVTKIAKEKGLIQLKNFL